ncbi:UDP-2,3-diacylglucosamine diphosphatase [Thalassotalea sp. PS06]|uniref:UDP-2,3-diacylglucosamine diphosphatase n=1 Tax=Thalassotalea sp. PS06 TaxID=2594005 RepID=UPI00116299D2|nr:UDP-2,3-diacylglucosamine diphosphatase [Thalassotalea sp. PS06]QDP01833.1 UDP-2,3-diacylglucosamine diphosphatase [Thalassotalea sp. PS06]
MSRLIYFIADLHLSDERADISACFFEFLKNTASKADQLYILGDLFEYWVGDDNVTPLSSSVATALKSLSDSGTEIFFIQGNRDFLLGKKYAEQCGMTLLPDTQLIELDGKPALIMHGDTLCTRDIDYQKFRAKSRTWWWQGFMTRLPLALRRKIAQNYRTKSAMSTSKKSQEIMDVTQSEVEKVLADSQCDLLIHGHTHRPAVHNFDVQGKPATRIVLGDWYEQGAWLKVEDGQMELLNQPFVPT